MSGLNENKKSKIAEIQRIKNEIKSLNARKYEIEKELPTVIIYENSDGTWTRVNKTDNVAKIAKGDPVYSSASFSHYSVSIKILKTMPKELK